MTKEITYRYRGYLYHLVLTFEDNGEKMHIVKYYGKHKQWWHYEVWSDWELEQVLKKK